MAIPDGLTVENTRWSEILIEKRLFPYTMHLHSMVQYSAEILPQGWYEDMVTRFNTIHNTADSKTDGRTHRGGIGRAYAYSIAPLFVRKKCENVRNIFPDGVVM